MIRRRMARDEMNRQLIMTVEKIGLVCRYLVFLMLGALYVSGVLPGTRFDFVLVASIVLAHNALVHGILWAGKYRLFLHPLNFLLYVFEATTLVVLTGSDNSDAYLLYFLVIICFGAYHRRLGLTLLATAFCILAYAAVLGLEWYRVGISESWGNLGGRLMLMGTCGWLIGSLSVGLRAIEDEFRAQAEALSASEATLRTILDSAAEAIVVYDEREFITEANDRAREFLGLPREQLLGRRIRSFMFDDGTLPNRFASLRARGSYHGEVIFINAEGEERTVDFRVRSYISEGQRFFVAVANDITEQKNLQEATRLANANLERLNRELLSVDQLKTGFLMTMSKRLRSPLAAVLGFIEMLLEEELGEINADQRKALLTSRRAILRVFKMVDEALDLRRGTSQEPYDAPAP